MENPAKALKQILCPRCKQNTIYSPENPFRPFCSKRCQTIDLGQWAEGTYRIPTEAHEFPENLESGEESD